MDIENKTTDEPTATAIPSKRRRKGKNSSVLTSRVLVNCNLGNTTITTAVSMKDFFSMSVVANKENANSPEDVAQRNLNMAHAKKLAVYMIKGLMQYAQKLRKEDGDEPNPIIDEILDTIGRQAYTSVQPFVCNIRNCSESLEELGYTEQLDASGFPVGATIRLTRDTLLYLVDGQHRREAMRIVLDFFRNSQSIKKLPKTSLLAPYQINNHITFSDAMAELLEVAETEPTAQIECHTGLDIVKERQLFSDMNNKARKVEQNITTLFDSSNPICSLASMVQKNPICDAVNELSTDQAITVTSKMVANTYTPKPCTSVFVRERSHVVYDFWESVTESKQVNQNETNMLNSIGILKALAGLLHKFSFSRSADEDMANKLIELIKTYDFDLKTNPVFKIQLLTREGAEELKLAYITDRLEKHNMIEPCYTKENINDLSIISNQKAKLVKVYFNVFLAILENS